MAALQRFDQLAAMSSRGDPEGCSTALTELAALREAGAVFELGPNVHNRAMRVCSAELETVETLYAQLAEEDRQDTASLELLASIRLENDMLVEAAEAVAELLAPALEVKTNKLGRLLPRRKVVLISPPPLAPPPPAGCQYSGEGLPNCQVPERTARVTHAVLEACAEAGLSEDHQQSGAPQLWAQLGAAGLWAPPPPPPMLERTLALLKPDCLLAGAEGEVEDLAATHGFRTVCRRQWRMDAREAEAFLATSWGSAAGDRQRRFFSDMVGFYCSGDVLALLLEKEGAICAWRALLGPGDPAVARGYTDRFGRAHRPKAPRSVRALYGTNKQANAAHGADSPEAARREISLIFGAELVEPGATQEITPPL